MPRKVEILKLGELFCGAGGIALGAKNAHVTIEGGLFRYEHEWAIDYDADACKTFLRNICPDEPAKVICSDVKRLNIPSLSPIDVFAFGFPCNDYSVVGEHKGINGSFGPLYLHGIRILDYFKPKCFIAENVGGITSANEGNTFRQILSDLEQAGRGYSLTAHLYHAENYGVPQTRKRIIIVGIEKRLHKQFRVPQPTTLQPITARLAIENPPIGPNAANHEFTRHPRNVVERLKRISPGDNAWTASLPSSLKLNVKGAKLSQIYRRLHPDKPAYTITGSGGGGTHCYHWSEPRALTNRERARLQSFPDTFIFEGSKESVRRQIGMAVPPRLAEEILRAVIHTIAGVEYPEVLPNLRFQPNEYHLPLLRRMAEDAII
jgi:DNA (cytosine-5)-methyltransferase 1